MSPFMCYSLPKSRGSDATLETKALTSDIIASHFYLQASASPDSVQLLGSQGLWQWLSSKMPCVHSDESQAQTQTWCDRAARVSCPSVSLVVGIASCSPCYGPAL